MNAADMDRVRQSMQAATPRQSAQLLQAQARPSSVAAERSSLPRGSATSVPRASNPTLPRTSLSAAPRASTLGQRVSTTESDPSPGAAAPAATYRTSVTIPINDWTPEAATPEHDPMKAAATAAATKKSKQSRSTLLRDPAINTEIAGGVKSRAATAAMYGGRRSSTSAGAYGGNTNASAALNKYRSRRQLTGRGDCPPDQNYLEAPFVESARRTGRFMHVAWIDQAICDVVLQTADGDLLAHRLVLAAISPTLDALFRQKPPDVDPTLTPQINLVEFRRETVADVVNFAYTGSIELDCKNIGPVTACAKELDFEIVVRICDDYLIDQCDPDNIILHYSVAANNDLTDTRDRLLTVICEAFPEISK